MKICFCTVVRNRLHHIRETLEKNIECNSDYEKLQFVVLDYNSNDGLEEWIRVNMQKHIISGRLVFYRTNEPAFFHRSHSRNMVMKLADGEVICNIDADNFTGPSFAKYIGEYFGCNEHIYMCTYAPGISVKADVLGRICLRKHDFTLVAGYDEAMDCYGFEDYDMMNRLGLLGLEKKVIQQADFLNAIAHSDYDRICDERLMKLFHSLHVHYISSAKCEVLILFKDENYLLGKLIDCRSLYAANSVYAFSDTVCKYEYTLEKGNWARGTWLETETTMLLKKGVFEMKLIKYKGGTCKYSRKQFYRITNENLITEIIMFCSQFQNRSKMEKNTHLEKASTSKDHFGKGRVFKNFDTSTAICI